MRISYYSFQDSALRATPLEGKYFRGNLKNAQPGFYWSHILDTKMPKEVIFVITLYLPCHPGLFALWICTRLLLANQRPPFFVSWLVFFFFFALSLGLTSFLCYFSWLVFLLCFGFSFSFGSTCLIDAWSWLILVVLIGRLVGWLVGVSWFLLYLTALDGSSASWALVFGFWCLFDACPWSLCSRGYNFLPRKKPFYPKFYHSRVQKCDDIVSQWCAW